MADPAAPVPRRAGSGPAVLGRVHRHQPGQGRDRGAARIGVDVAVDAAGKPRPVDESGLPVAQVAELTLLLPGLTNGGLAGRDAGPGPPGTAPPRRQDQRVRSPRRLALPMRGHRHRPRTAARSWRPGTAPTPASRTGSKRSSRPAWAASRPASFSINQVWLQLALTAADLIAWTQTILLDGALADAETEEAALPTAPHRRPDRPRPTQGPDQNRHQLALGHPARRRVHPTRPDPTTTTRLTRQPPPSTHHPRNQENRTPGRPISLPTQTRSTSQPSPTADHDHLDAYRKTEASWGPGAP